MKKIILLLPVLVSIFFASAQNKKQAEKISSPGKHHFPITIDGDIREFYVHIPKCYDSSMSFPVVLMLHGSGGNGLKFYNISGWVQEGEADSIITVFPSSWKYDCVIDDSIKKFNAEKWTSYDLQLCKNVKRRDDVKFLAKVIEQVRMKYNVDSTRIYMVGFSNGGEMAARCAIELSGKLAAVVACAGSLPPDTTLVPVKILPVLLQMGTVDSNVMRKVGATTAFPLDIPLLFSTYSAIQSIVNSYINSFGVGTAYTIQNQAGKYTMALYTGTSGTQNIFNFIEIQGLGHEYPNGKNHPLKGAKAHWDWMKNYRL